MDRAFGNHTLHRSSAGSTPVLVPRDVPFPGNLLDHQFGRSNSPEIGAQNPFFIGIHQDQPLEDVFSRLNLSSGVGGGSMLGDTVTGGYGFLPLSLQQIQQTNDEFQSWSFPRSGIDTFGEVGLGNHEVRASAESRDGFLGFSNPTSVIRGLSTESRKRSLGAERYASWNQSSRQFQRPELSSAVSIMPRSNQNRPLRGPVVDSCGEVDGWVSENLTSSRPASYNRGLNNHFNHQLQQYLSLNYLCLEDFRGRVVPLAMNQHGCRFLQEKLQNNVTVKEIEMIFSEVIHHVAQLMLDQFGNYVVQKLVEICNEEQRTQILLSATTNQYQLIFICLNMHGTRVMQKLLEYLTTPEQVSIAMSALWPVTVALTKDTSGHHVIQHCLKLFSCQDNMYLIKEVAENCFEIATNRSGCCVLQSCVENSQGELREQLMAEIIANALPLAEDRYGNYVVQHLMGLKIPEVITNLLKQFEGTFISLSCNKYGSNVVEKFLIESKDEQSSQIIIELLRSPNVSMLLLDPFGNFVIQSALSVSKGHIRNALVNLVRLHAPSMRSNLYGKKVLTWFDKRKLQHLYM